jgi:hypothetical protein
MSIKDIFTDTPKKFIVLGIAIALIGAAALIEAFR